MNDMKPSYAGKRSSGLVAANVSEKPTSCPNPFYTGKRSLGDKYKIGKTEFLSLNPSYTGKRSLGQKILRKHIVTAGLNPSYTGKRSLGFLRLFCLRPQIQSLNPSYTGKRSLGVSEPTTKVVTGS